MIKVFSFKIHYFGQEIISSGIAERTVDLNVWRSAVPHGIGPLASVLCKSVSSIQSFVAWLIMHLLSDWFCAKARNTGVNAIPQSHGGVWIEAGGEAVWRVGDRSVWAKEQIQWCSGKELVSSGPGWFRMKGEDKKRERHTYKMEGLNKTTHWILPVLSTFIFYIESENLGFTTYYHNDYMQILSVSKPQCPNL